MLKPSVPSPPLVPGPRSSATTRTGYPARVKHRPWIGGGLAVLVAGAACAGCGHRKQTSTSNGSGSSGSDDPSEVWQVVRTTDDTAIVVRGTRVAVVDPTGRVLSHPALTPALAEDAPMRGRMVAWLDGTNDDELNLVDLSTGMLRWHATTAHRGESVIFGARSIGVLTVEGVELRHLDGGALGYHHLGPRMVDAAYQDGTFVFIDDAGMVEAVDEARDVQRWAFDVNASSVRDNNYVHFEGGNVIAPGWQIDVATGKARPRTSRSTNVLNEAEIYEIARTNEGTRLVADSPANAHRKMHLLDARGAEVWSSSEWSRFLELSYAFSRTNVAITKPEAGVVVLESESPPVRMLVGFDNKTGHVRYDRKIGKGDELVGGDDDCIGFLDRSNAPKLQCLDDKTGELRWEHVMTGTGGRAWHLKRHWIVASGSPALLESLDNTGKVLWRTTLPATTVAESSVTGLLAHRGTSGEQMWELGPSFFILPEARDVSVVDIATGKLTKVTP